MKFLIDCTNCFIGDILFASSIAKKLHEEHNHPIVDYKISLIQPLNLLRNNPYIRNVYVNKDSSEIYDKVVVIPIVDQAWPATIQFQVAAGIKNPSLNYDIHLSLTNATDNLQHIKSKTHKPLVAYQLNWEWKAYQSTEELLSQGKGGPHRDIDKIISYLKSSNKMILYPVGFDKTVSQTDPIAADPGGYEATAEFIKNCDWMIGSEGGLTNLAAGLGTKCIITTDYIWQNYGPLGLVRPTPQPMMGPAVYYPNSGHVHLHPYMTDEEVACTIEEIILGE